MTRARLFIIAAGVACFACFARGDDGIGIPRVPFSGIYGATAGAGSLTGWDRLGGDNPAALMAAGAPGWTASAAGYAPFGLDGARMTEVESARDAGRWGASLGVRALTGEDVGGASFVRARLAARLARGFVAGGTLRVDFAPESGEGFGSGNITAGMGAGVIWRPAPFAAVGMAWEDGTVGVGVDGGTRLGGAGGIAWRVTAERMFGEIEEYRFGFGLRLHALLSVHAGWAPERETASLGVRFGAGAWEGFSALRRHAALGGTSIQGVRWTRATDGKGVAEN